MKSKNKVAQQQTKKPNVSTPPANKPKKRGISSYSTAEMATHLATRGYSIRKANEKVEPKPYPIQEERGSEAGPVMSTDKPGLLLIFEVAQQHNEQLRSFVNILEDKGYQLFGHRELCDQSEKCKSEDPTTIEQKFNEIGAVRISLLNRLAEVTKGFANFIS